MPRTFKDNLTSCLNLAKTNLNRLTTPSLTQALVKAIGVGVVLAFTLAPAHANLIQNGGFETGTLASWTSTGNVGIAKLPYFGEGSAAANGSFFSAFNAGNTPPTGVLSQIFTTNPGSQYILTYSYGSNGGQRQSVTTSLRDAQGATLATQFTTLPTVSAALAPFSLAFTADTTFSTLSFTDYAANPTAGTDGFIDNVSVEAVPEPSSLVLLALPLLCASVFGCIRTRATRSV